MITFPIKTPYIELYKLLKAAGLCESGGQAKLFIAEGGVLVDGHVETRKARKIKPGQKVELEGEIIEVTSLM